MKIGIDARVFSGDNVSGIPQYASRLIKSLLEIDTQNNYGLFCNSFFGSNLPGGLEDTQAQIIKSRWSNKFLNFNLRTRDKPQIDKLLEADVYFMPHFNFSSFSQDSKSILTLHDLSFLRHKEFFSWRKNLWHYSVDIKKLVSKVDTLVAVSEHTKRDAIDLLGVKENKIKVIYSGVNDSDNFNQLQKEKIKFKYSLPDNFIFSLSTIEPRKNIDGLIKAFDLFCDKNAEVDCKLVVAGAWGWKTDSVMSAYESSRNKKKIIFLGKIKEADKHFIYSLAKIFVYPSFYEGFGFPPLEAMSAGTPVISSNISSLPEILSDSALLINPYNVIEIAETMDILFNSEKLRLSLKQKSKERLRFFSWEKTARQYLDLFHELKF